jgi:hypothetical protein
MRGVEAPIPTFELNGFTHELKQIIFGPQQIIFYQ